MATDAANQQTSPSAPAPVAPPLTSPRGKHTPVPGSGPGPEEYMMGSATKQGDATEKKMRELENNIKELEAVIKE